MSMAAHSRVSRHHAYILAVLLPAAAAAAACDVAHMQMAGRASEEWTRTYPLTSGGEIEIINTNGKIEVEGADAEQAEVRAERVAKAGTDAAARDLLPRVTISEDVKPDHVRIETGRLDGINIGIGFEVNYKVRVPRGTVVRLRNTNGQVSAVGTNGVLFATTTNGGVKAVDVTGDITARSTNGGVEIQMAELTGKVSLSTTNGGVSLVLPDEAKADLSASCTNGGISVSGLKLETTESTRRRLEGRLNGGGTLIDLRTTNGGIRVRSRSSPAETH
jgi:hypothetical protein